MSRREGRAPTDKHAHVQEVAADLARKEADELAAAERARKEAEEKAAAERARKPAPLNIQCCPFPFHPFPLSLVSRHQ